MPTFKVQFPASEIEALATRFGYADDARLLAVGAAARTRGYYTREEFVEACAWKRLAAGRRSPATRRPRWSRRPARRSPCSDEATRMNALLELEGVEYHRLDARLRRVSGRLPDPRRAGARIPRRQAPIAVPAELLASVPDGLPRTRPPPRCEHPDAGQGAVAVLQGAWRRRRTRHVVIPRPGQVELAAGTVATRLRTARPSALARPTRRRRLATAQVLGGAPLRPRSSSPWKSERRMRTRLPLV